ncbi:MAG: metallophosphoesterase, partial [Ignavibacteriaceae bacterium]|nr:metallophosphoesterase [Ignavibacteriaceae bacterium]
MILFFISFFLLFTLVNYYLIRRGNQALEGASKLVRIVFTIVTIIASLSYVGARSLFANSGTILYDQLLFIGSIWYVFLMYGVISILILDFVRYILKKSKSKLIENPGFYKKTKLQIFSFISLSITLLVLYGYFNAQNIKVKTFELTFPKGEGNLESLNIVFFSDSHLTPINDGIFADRLVQEVNQLNPDLILLGGDIIDDNSMNLDRHEISTKLKKLKSLHGVFTCNGNHEYIVGIDEAQDYLAKSNIVVLRDSVLVIANSLQVISRDDRQRNRFSDENRKSLRELVNSSNKNLPSILLDHQPFDLDSSAY